MNRSPILLTERIDHLEYFSKFFIPRLKNTLVFHGRLNSKQRKTQFDKMSRISESEPRLIIATGRYLGEGFDDDRLDTLFLTLPVSWRGIIAQYAGRLHRLHDQKKDVIIYDYADLDIPVLAKMFKRRKSGYKAIGYRVLE